MCKRTDHVILLNAGGGKAELFRRYASLTGWRTVEHKLFHGINQIVNVVVSTRFILEACLNVSVTQVTDSLSSTDSLVQLLRQPSWALSRPRISRAGFLTSNITRKRPYQDFKRKTTSVLSP